MAGKFDSRKLEKAVGEMISNSIGDQLSTIRKDVGEGVIEEVPSVIFARETSIDGKIAYPPDYPFIMLETTGAVKDHELIAEYLDIEDEYQYSEQSAGSGIMSAGNSLAVATDMHFVDAVYKGVYETTVTGRVNVKVFGTRDHDIEDIASDLEQAFTVDDYRDQIDIYYQGCRWMGTSNPLPSYNTINNIYQGVVTFDVYFSIVRQHIILNVDTFDTVQVDPKELVHVGDVPLGDL